VRRERWEKLCARVALDALLGGRSTSPLESAAKTRLESHEELGAGAEDPSLDAFIVRVRAIDDAFCDATAVPSLHCTATSARAQWAGLWRPLTNAGAVRDSSSASSPSARKKVCALVSLDALTRGRSASPLGVQMSAQRVVSASWQGQPVSVSCHMVSRYAWTSATIDVAVGEQVVLRTGGAAKVTGRHAETFEFRGTRHTAELSWGVSLWYAFPFSLTIDGTEIVKSRVSISNWWLAWWPFYLALGIGVCWVLLR